MTCRRDDILVLPRSHRQV